MVVVGGHGCLFIFFHVPRVLNVLMVGKKSINNVTAVVRKVSSS